MGRSDAPGRLRVGSTELECERLGEGAPMLVLHGAGGPLAQAPFVASLAREFDLILPSHPGFGRSARAAGITTVDDLAYLYLDLLDEQRIDNAIVMGFSMGGWTAVEMATKSCERISRVILVDSVGVKFGDRETREFPDLFATTPEDLAKLAFHDPAKAVAPDFKNMSEEELTIFARNREAMALYLWEPYLHNPKLKQRLHRVKVPTHFIWGESDGLATPEYGRRFADCITGATFDLIEQAGHAPQIEQPEAFVAQVLARATALDPS